MNNVPLYPKTYTVLLHLSPPEYIIFREALLKFGAVPSGNGLFNKEHALERALAQAFTQSEWPHVFDD